MNSLGKILLAFALLNFVLQGQICLLLHLSLYFLLLHSILLIKKRHLLGLLVLEGLLGQALGSFIITGQGIDLNYCDIECFALERSRDHSVVFETTPKYHILESFVDYEGYSISSKGFLTTVVDIMVI